MSLPSSNTVFLMAAATWIGSAAVSPFEASSNAKLSTIEVKHSEGKIAESPKQIRASSIIGRILLTSDCSEIRFDSAEALAASNFPANAYEDSPMVLGWDGPILQEIKSAAMHRKPVKHKKMELSLVCIFLADHGNVLSNYMLNRLNNQPRTQKIHPGVNDQPRSKLREIKTIEI
jgi:hypothetical protein